MTCALRHRLNILDMTAHYTGHTTTNRSYTDVSKCNSKVGRAINHGALTAALHVRGPGHVHKAEILACALALQLVPPKDEIILDNHGLIIANCHCKSHLTTHQ